MKILAIPDVHGSKNWEKAKDLINEVDKVVFLGDFVDSWENVHPDQLINIHNILEFKKSNPDKVVVLLGNHDFSYISTTKYGAEVSGHQHEHAFEIRNLFVSNIELFDIAAEFDGFIFSHAGFTKTWVKEVKEYFHNKFDKWSERFGGHLIESWDESKFNPNLLNAYFHSLSRENNDFDEFLDWRGCFSGSGDEITQGPLWVRPASLMKDAYYPKQVVGHTESAIFGEPIRYANKENEFYVVDNSEHDLLFILDTENETIPKISILEFERLLKRVEKTVNIVIDMVRNNGTPVSKEEVSNMLNNEKFSQFTENQKKTIVNYAYHFLENTFFGI